MHIQMDTKELYDIAADWPAMTQGGLPRCQSTARDVVSELSFTAFAQERSRT